MRGKTLGVLATLALALGFAFAGCNGADDNAITLENFENMEVNALLDGSYTLPIGNVSDSEGNDYEVTYAVKTASDKAVSVNNNAFWIKSFEDHIITCSATVAEGDVRTRTITVKVKDEGAPVITFGRVKRGMVGTEYTVPEITVFDSSLETISPSVKLYELNGEEKGDEIPLTDGKFTPTEMGYYALEATATDSSGNTGAESATVYVRAPIAAAEVISFTYEEDADNVGWSQTNGTITWLEEYEDESGVVRFSYTGKQWANAFTFLPLCDASAASSVYTNYDELIVRMYIANTSEFTNYFTHPDDKLVITQYDELGATLATYQSKNVIEYNEWVDYRFNINALRAFAMEELNVYNAKLWGYGVKNMSGETEVAHDGEFYVSDISVAKAVELYVEGNTCVGNTVTITNEYNDTNATVTVTAPDGTVTTLTDGTYDITQKGVHTVWVRGDGYFGRKTFTATRAYTTNEFMSFDYEEDIASAYTAAASPVTATLTREASFEGETGVLKLDWNGSKWPALSVKPIQGQTAFADYDYVVIRTYVPSSSPVKYLKINNIPGGAYEPLDTIVYLDTWHNYVFDIRAFAEWSDDYTVNDLWSNQYKLWSEFDGVTEGQIYISDISFAKKGTVEISGTTSAAQTVTFGFSDATATPTSLYVVNAENELSRINGANYTIPSKGVYTVYVFADGYYNKATLTATRAYGATEFMSFDYAEDIDNVYATASNATVALSIEETFENETGVLKMEWSGNKWPALSVKPLLGKNEYKNYDYVVMRIWTPSESPVKYWKINNTTGGAYEAIDATYTTDAWVDYKFDIRALNAWQDGYTAQELWVNQFRIWSEFDGVTEGTIYIADISFSN